MEKWDWVGKCRHISRSGAELGCIDGVGEHIAIVLGSLSR